MSDTGDLFIDRSRKFINEDLLPRIERCVQQLTDEQVWWRSNETSNSIGNLLLHLSGNVRQWIVSGLGGEPDRRQRQQEFDERSKIPRSDLISKLREAVKDADTVLQRLDSKVLLETRHIQNHDVSGLEAIYHVVEHFSMHTGQIILLTKMIAARDLEFYDVSSGAPRRRW
ncbi:MAG TPA: DinB family protein [Acidobacteriota bacterium]|jgi:uncharacterized damage-inducible protein DinB